MALYLAAFRINEQQVLIVHEDGRISFGNLDQHTHRVQRGVPVFASVDDYDGENITMESIQIFEVGVLSGERWIEILPFSKPQPFASMRAAYQTLVEHIRNSGFPVFWLTDMRAYSVMPSIPAH